MFAAAPLAHLLPPPIRDRFEALHEAETERYLAELGYAEPHTESAIARFRAELSALAVQDPQALTSLTQDLYWGLSLGEETDSLNHEELECLKALCDLEGGFVLSDMALQAQPALSRRVLGYRLRRLGLLAEGAQTAAQITAALQRLGQLSGAEQRSEWLQLSGHIGLLSEALMPRLPGLLYFELVEGQGSSMLGKARGKQFVAAFEAAATAAEQEQFRREVLDRHGRSTERKALRAWLASAASDARNALMRRVLQLRLWMSGFWEGDPEADWDKDLQKALTRYIDFSAQYHNDPDSVQSATWTQINRKFAVLSIYQLRQLSDDLSGQAGRPESLLQTLHAWYEGDQTEAADTSAQDLQGNLRAQLDALAGGARRVPARPGHAGTRSLLRMLDWLKAESRDVRVTLERFLGQVRHSTQGMLALLKAGFYRLDRALELLLERKPRTFLYGGMRIRVEFSGDFDLLQVLHGSPEPEALQAHLAFLRQLTARFLQAMNCLSTLIQWGLNARPGPENWVRTGVRIAQLFR